MGLATLSSSHAGFKIGEEGGKDAFVSIAADRWVFWSAKHWQSVERMHVSLILCKCTSQSGDLK